MTLGGSADAPGGTPGRTEADAETGRTPFIQREIDNAAMSLIVWRSRRTSHNGIRSANHCGVQCRLRSIVC
jgi:hypothetical protein